MKKFLSGYFLFGLEQMYIRVGRSWRLAKDIISERNNDRENG